MIGTTVVVGVLILVGIVAFVVRKLMVEDTGAVRQVQEVSLIKPPPPPKVEELPPQPEVQKEEIVAPEEAAPEEPEGPSDEPPPGQDLGVDAEGVAGSDSFGLVGKKGGRSLIGGGGSGIQHYAFYTNMLKDEILRRLEKAGGLPPGCQTVVIVELDERGAVKGCRIAGSSGNRRMDDAVLRAVGKIRALREPPPAGMLRKIRVRVVWPS